MANPGNSTRGLDQIEHGLYTVCSRFLKFSQCETDIDKQMMDCRNNIAQSWSIILLCVLVVARRSGAKSVSRKG
jgi:hypothetical protein